MAAGTYTGVYHLSTRFSNYLGRQRPQAANTMMEVLQCPLTTDGVILDMSLRRRGFVPGTLNY